MKRIILLLFCLMMSLCEGSINFVHIPKTGGTTLHHLLYPNFHNHQIYPYRSLEEGRSVTILKDEVEIVLNEYPLIHHKLVSGHFPIWFLKDKDPHFETSYFFTVLRDPIERVLSNDRYRVKELHKKGIPAESNPLLRAHNVMCIMLSSDCTLQGEELLEDAINSLKRMNCIIFLDDFEQGIKRLFTDLGFRIPKQIPRLNVTENKPISDEIIAQLKELNALDIQLYEYANQHFR